MVAFLTPCRSDRAPGYNDDYDVTVWAAAVEVLQHHDAGGGQSDFAVLVIQQALRLAAATRSAALYQALMKVRPPLSAHCLV